MPCALCLKPSKWDGHYLSRPPETVNVTWASKIMVNPDNSWTGLGPKVEKHFPHQRTLLLSRTEHDLVRLCEVLLEHLGTIFVLLWSHLGDSSTLADKKTRDWMIPSVERKKVENFYTFRPILPFRQPFRLKPSYRFLAVPTPSRKGRIHNILSVTNLLKQL